MNHDTRSLIGASVLSGAGSLPLHLAPLIVAVLVAGGQTSIADAGLIASMVLLGQLVMAVILPIINARQIGQYYTAAAAGILLVNLMLSTSYLLVSWFNIGLCCGLFQYVGTLTAALHSRPAYAFPIRLGTTLCLAGATVAAVRMMPVSSYAMLLFVLAAMFAILLTIGVALHQPIQPPASKAGSDPERWQAYAVLVVVFLLFVGQTGLLAYVIQQATVRGIGFGQAVWALAIMKVLAGLMLLAQPRINLWILSLSLAAANVIVSSTTNLAIFVTALLLLEISFNLLSAKLSAKAASFAPILAGQWLVAVMLLGAATGPTLHGYAGAGGLAFVSLAVLSAIFPMTLRRTA